MKNKRHMSLMAEVLVGSIGSMLFVTVFLCVSYMVVMLHGIKQSCINSVGQTMETLNKEVSGILGEYDNYTLPQPLEVETPESKKKLAEFYKEAKAMAARHHKEAEEEMAE